MNGGGGVVCDEEPGVAEEEAWPAPRALGRSRDEIDVVVTVVTILQFT